MGVTPFPMIDPATSYRMMTSGAGPGPTLATGEVYGAHAATMAGTLATSQVNAGGTFPDWTGAGGDAAQLALVSHNAQQLTHADETLLKAALFQQAATIHSATVTRMVPDVVPDANRAESAADILINPWVLGALTPRITELQLEYVAMWANNAQAGVGYGFGLDGIGVALAGLAGLPAIAGGSVAAAAMAAAQIGETAAISGLGVAMSTAEQGATALIGPATAATTSSTSSATNAMLGNAPLAAPATPHSSIQPMAAVQTYAPPTPSAPALTQAQTPVMGMFAPPPSAAVTPPAPSPSLPATVPPVAAAPPMPAAAPGVTSFVPPAQPFAPPPPTAGRAAGLGPGMLNAAALRGPVSTMPLTTTATSTLATAAQPLAYVPPEPPLSLQTPPPPRPPLDTSGTVNTINPPPAPPAQPPPPPAPPPPTPLAPPQSGQPAPSDGPGPGPGTGGPGLDIQMLGTGLGGAPLAPPGIPPMPLDTPPTPAQIEGMTKQEALDAWDKLNSDKESYKGRCDPSIVGRLPPGPYSACLNEWGELNTREAALRARLGQLGVPIADEPTPPPTQPSAPEAPAETPPFPPPKQITGLTDHGEQQVMSRDGHGVNERALQDAVNNPIGPPKFKPDQYGGSYLYIGKDATVALNKDGQVTTAWANSRNGWRNP